MVSLRYLLSFGYGAALAFARASPPHEQKETEVSLRNLLSLVACRRSKSDTLLAPHCAAVKPGAGIAHVAGSRRAFRHWK